MLHYIFTQVQQLFYTFKTGSVHAPWSSWHIRQKPLPNTYVCRWRWHKWKWLPRSLPLHCDSIQCQIINRVVKVWKSIRITYFCLFSYDHEALTDPSIFYTSTTVNISACCRRGFLWYRHHHSSTHFKLPKSMWLFKADSTSQKKLIEVFLSTFYLE